VGTSQVKRRIGPKHVPSTRQGMTRAQAEAELRRLMGSVVPSVARAERVTIEEAGELLVERVRAKGRKRATLDRIGRREIEAFIVSMERTGRSPKTTLTRSGSCTRSSSTPAARSGSRPIPARSSRSRDRAAAIRTSTSSSPRRSRRCCAASPTTTSAASSAACTSRPP